VKEKEEVQEIGYLKGKVDEVTKDLNQTKTVFATKLKEAQTVITQKD
jgi:hypothetical protein